MAEDCCTTAACLPKALPLRARRDQAGAGVAGALDWPVLAAAARYEPTALWECGIPTEHRARPSKEMEAPADTDRIFEARAMVTGFAPQ